MIDEPSKGQVPSPGMGLETVELGVEGMTCDHCARRVEQALRAVPGVEAASVDRPNRRATITFDPARASLPQLRSTIRQAGYQPLGG